MGARLSTGYGVLTICRKPIKAHRQAWVLRHGAIPPNMCVLHGCDNPLCVEPDHLWLGTPSDNVHDMIRKKRYRYCRGEEHGGAKLTEGDVRAIRGAAAAGESQRSIASRFCVCSETVRKIVIGRNWSCVR